VFGEQSSTRDLFNVAIKGLVASVVDGYNGTVFAYGQTAAGKTHTMLGSKGTPGSASRVRRTRRAPRVAHRARAHAAPSTAATAPQSSRSP
jgi:hypothetical protein